MCFCRNFLVKTSSYQKHFTLFPGMICPGDICPYQQYLSCYWYDFDQTFWTQFFGGHKCCGSKCSWTKLLQTQPFFWTIIFFSEPKFRAQNFRTSNFTGPKNFWTPNFSDPNFFFRPEIFFALKFFFRTNIFFKIFFWTQNFFWPKSFWTPNFLWTQRQSLSKMNTKQHNLLSIVNLSICWV